MRNPALETARWSQSQTGALFLTAITQWELHRLAGDMDIDELIRPDWLRGRRLTLPRYWWDGPLGDPGFGLLQHIAQDEGDAVILTVV